MNKSLSKFIEFALIVILVLGGIGFISKFTNNFESDFSSFYVVIDNKIITTSDSGYTLDANEKLKVDVKYLFNFSEEERDYSVKIVPNIVENKDFIFAADSYEYYYQRIEDLTNGFNIEKNSGSFTFSPKGNLMEILQIVYSSKEVSDCSNNSYEDMFKLVITSYNEKASVSICFSVNEKITGVTLDKTLIEF